MTKEEDHKLSVEIRGIRNVLSLGRATIAVANQKAETDKRSQQGAQANGRDDGGSCLALDGEIVGDPHFYAVEKLVADRQQNWVGQTKCDGTAVCRATKDETPPSTPHRIKLEDIMTVSNGKR